MPFVTIVSPSIIWEPVQSLVDIMEVACKKTWTAMGELEHEVGGVSGRFLGAELYPHALHIIFQYVDRDEEFKDRLRETLHQEIIAALRSENIHWEIYVTLMPTNKWFKDPTWSQAPCRRPHIEGLTPSGYDDGWR